MKEYDELCPRCGVGMQATHAPWCEFRDGTSVPDEYVEIIKALEDYKETFRRFAISTKSVSGHNDALLWALAQLAEYQAHMLAALAGGGNLTLPPF